MPEPQVLITPTTITCASHGEHLRAQWPKGYMIVGLSLFKAAVADPRFQRQARKVLRKPFGKVPVKVINEITAKTPFCYYVTRDQMREALIDAEILTRQRCDLCGVVRFAGPYDILYDDERLTKIVCVECCLDAGEREHAYFPKGPPPRG